MKPVRCPFRFRPSALEHLDQIVAHFVSRGDKTISRERFLFLRLRDVAKSYATVYDSIRDTGSAVVNGRRIVEVDVGEMLPLPELSVPAGSSLAEVSVLLGEKLLERLAKGFVIVDALSKGAADWDGFYDWMNTYLAQTIAASYSSLEDELIGKEEEDAREAKMLETAREERRAELLGVRRGGVAHG